MDKKELQEAISSSGERVIAVFNSSANKIFNRSKAPIRLFGLYKNQYGEIVTLNSKDVEKIEQITKQNGKVTNFIMYRGEICTWGDYGCHTCGHRHTIIYKLIDEETLNCFY